MSLHAPERLAEVEDDVAVIALEAADEMLHIRTRAKSKRRVNSGREKTGTHGPQLRGPFPVPAGHEDLIFSQLIDCVPRLERKVGYTTGRLRMLVL